MGTGDSYWASVETSDDFVLEVPVTDDDNDTYSDSLSVGVGSSYASC